MKKIISILLLICIVSSLCVVAVIGSNAKVTYKYKNEFSKFALGDLYEEHKDEVVYYEYYSFFSDDNKTDTPDWVFGIGYTLGSESTSDWLVFDDYAIQSMGCSNPFECGYFIYIPEENKFYDFEQMWNCEFENLELALEECASTAIGGVYRLYDADHMYEADFIQKFGAGYGYEYDEKYYYKDEYDNVEWCLVYAIKTHGPPAPFYTIFGDYISLQGAYLPFSTMFGVYDEKEDAFYDLKDIENFDKYDGLIEQLFNYDRFMYPIGDADNDRKLTVMDATFIQRVSARLCKYNLDDDVSGRFVYGSEKISYISDYDRDGERSVMDATAIQLKLAGLE